MLSTGFRKLVIRAGDSRRVLLALYYVWRAFPYPLRRLVTALFTMHVLAMKAVFRVEGQAALTPASRLGSLAFWGIPQIDPATYVLRVDGDVDAPLTLSLGELSAMVSVKREVRMDCVGGFRNNSIMDGIPLAILLERADLRPTARRAIFHCADLAERRAFLAHRVNGEAVGRPGYPLRLAVPGKYGYKWAKWLVRIELVADERKGYWERLGLPDRADVGDIW